VFDDCAGWLASEDSEFSGHEPLEALELQALELRAMAPVPWMTGSLKEDAMRAHLMVTGWPSSLAAQFDMHVLDGCLWKTWELLTGFECGEWRGDVVQ
jgi:hypothetical protein